MRITRPRLAPTLLLVAAAAFYSIFIERTGFRVQGRPFFTLIDDAMISMRYAQHLAQGHGLVWNVGQTPIEGFTSPGWMLVMAVLHLLRLPQNLISLVVMIISAIILILNAIVVHQVCLEIRPGRGVAPLLAAAVTAFYFPLVFWSLRGMEVGLLVLLLDLALLATLQLRENAPRAAIGLGLLLSAAVVVRLDAMLQVIVVLGYVVAFHPSGRRQRWISASIVIVTLVAILIFQRAYFGDILPNTYYQKMAGGAVDERLKHGILVFVQFAVRDIFIMALVVAVGLMRRPALRSPKLLLLAALFAVQCIYSVWVGGDYAEPEVASANRFVTQGVPALIILFAIVVDGGLASHARATGKGAPAWPTSLFLGALTLLVISGMPWYRWAENNGPLLQSDIRRARAGLALATFTAADATIAVHAAGQIPYYSQRQSIDLLGLNDPVIAHGPRRTAFYPGHDKWNYEYSLGELKPDLIADNWIRLADYMGQQNEYRKLHNGMYVRMDTTLVDIAGLQNAFP
jgi:hypothetical protein